MKKIHQNGMEKRESIKLL